MKFYKTEKGWGAITSDAVPEGDAWVHFSVIEGTGYRELTAGELVDFDFEPAQQDSFRYVATRVRRVAAGPAPTLRRRGDSVRIEPDDTPDTPLAERRPHRAT
ncbi:MAG: cold shock domain-containing protein [Janthinobacterium lividum]